MTRPPKQHSGSGWPILMWGAASCGVMSLVGIWQGWRPYAALMLLIGLGSSFIGGYCYRQQVLNSGSPATLPFLRLREDDDRP